MRGFIRIAALVLAVGVTLMASGACQKKVDGIGEEPRPEPQEKLSPGVRAESV